MENGILYYRKKLGLTQRKLAEKVGITPQSLSLYEKNKRKPSLGVLEKISKELDVQTRYLSILKMENKDIFDEMLSSLRYHWFTNDPVYLINGEEYDINYYGFRYFKAKKTEIPSWMKFYEKDTDESKINDFFQNNFKFLFTDEFIGNLQQKNAFNIRIDKAKYSLPLETLDSEIFIPLACEKMNDITREMEKENQSYASKTFNDIVFFNYEPKINFALSQKEFSKTKSLLNDFIKELQVFRDNL